MECNHAHRRPVSVLCLLLKIKSNPMHPLRGAFLLPYVPARVTRGALPSVAHRHWYVPPRCRTSQHCGSFMPISESLWNNLGDLVFDGVGFMGFKCRANAFLLALSAHHFVSYYFLFFFLPWLVVWGWGLRIGIVFSLSSNLALLTLFNPSRNALACALYQSRATAPPDAA